VTTDAGEMLTAQFLITAVGCLSTANIPDIPGLDNFGGRWYHTGQWPHEGVDFRGRRVGQIGTGSTGIQAAPVIAETAARLTVFQRTANYSVPARNGPLTPEFNRWIQDNMDEIRATMRAAVNGHPFLLSETGALEIPPEERLARYEKAWETGGLRFRAAFRDLVTSNEANATASAFLKDKIRRIVKDPAKAQKLADIDHPYAAKRPPIDTDYFETFNRDNVDLVDVRADPIERVTPAGIRLKSGAGYPLDIIVFATGFDGMTGSLLRMDIRGRGDLALKEAWKAGPRNYIGLQVAGFPNLFMVTGPGSPSVLCNMPVAIEQHVEWITDCIAHLKQKGLTRIEPREEAVDAWVAEVNKAADATVLPQAKHSWYLGANIPGKPRVFMPYAGGMAKYRRICNEIAARGYEGFKLSA
jgi:cation diffusion facilitator CzcD-associated flavoprotein CzcO